VSPRAKKKTSARPAVHRVDAAPPVMLSAGPPVMVSCPPPALTTFARRVMMSAPSAGDGVGAAGDVGPPPIVAPSPRDGVGPDR
jgi:hypothetical protein